MERSWEKGSSERGDESLPDSHFAIAPQALLTGPIQGRCSPVAGVRARLGQLEGESERLKERSTLIRRIIAAFASRNEGRSRRKTLSEGTAARDAFRSIHERLSQR